MSILQAGNICAPQIWSYYLGSAVVRIEKKSNVINNELSCFGPHVHPSGSSGLAFKIYQPYDGPSIRKSNIKEMIFFLQYCNSLN